MNLTLKMMMTRFILNQAWKHKGLALAGLAFYLYSQGKKKQEENTAPVASAHEEEPSPSGRPRSSRSRR